MDYNENAAAAVLQGGAANPWGVLFPWIQLWGKNLNLWGILLGPETLITTNLGNPEEKRQNWIQEALAMLASD